MVKQLKHILNSYTDEELEDVSLWINDNITISKIIVDRFCISGSINLITENTEVSINGIADKKRKEKYKEDE